VLFDREDPWPPEHGEGEPAAGGREVIEELPVVLIHAAADGREGVGHYVEEAALSLEDGGEGEALGDAGALAGRALVEVDGEIGAGEERR
jgi:hypothetical protein